MQESVFWWIQPGNLMALGLGCIGLVFGDRHQRIVDSNTYI
jgi:hypothetical protein